MPQFHTAVSLFDCSLFLPFLKIYHRHDACLCCKREKTKLKASENVWLAIKIRLLCLLKCWGFFSNNKNRIGEIDTAFFCENNSLIMWLVLFAGSCLVPVQHHSRKPAAGPSCDQCWTDSNDHPAIGQGLCAGFTLLTCTIFPSCRFPNTGVRMFNVRNKFRCRSTFVELLADKQFLNWSG